MIPDAKARRFIEAMRPTCGRRIIGKLPDERCASPLTRKGFAGTETVILVTCPVCDR